MPRKLRQALCLRKMKRNLTDIEASVLYYLLEKLELSHKDFTLWAYSQYEDDGALPWIEEAALTIDLSEAKDLLRREFHICYEMDSEFLAGEIASKFNSGEITDYEAVNRLFDFCSQAHWSKAEQEKIYIMEDYYGWHENPSSVVVPMLKEILSECEILYKDRMKIFELTET
ncbi:MAG: hypothetical protein HWE27_00500 [Gammaproteobacteria bacterium]|nr:hypothetical protein [Gammaproteobacteria bacterium]